jgi:hypothetical protein
MCIACATRRPGDERRVAHGRIGDEHRAKQRLCAHRDVERVARLVGDDTDAAGRDRPGGIDGWPVDVL